MTAEPAESYLTPDELVARWGGRIKPKTLANWRSTGDGPEYQKFGSKVSYPVSAVVAYEKRRRFQKTPKPDEGEKAES